MIYRLSACPTPPILNNHEKPLSPLSKPSVEPRHITIEEHQLFRNPENLHGKMFTLSSDDSALYEVIGYHKKRDKTVEYEILFDDCHGDSFTIGEEEMANMLFIYQLSLHSPDPSSCVSKKFLHMNGYKTHFFNEFEPAVFRKS